MDIFRECEKQAFPDNINFLTKGLLAKKLEDQEFTESEANNIIDLPLNDCVCQPDPKKITAKLLTFKEINRIEQELHGGS